MTQVKDVDATEAHDGTRVHIRILWTNGTQTRHTLPNHVGVKLAQQLHRIYPGAAPTD